MIKVLVFGINGKMGKVLVDEISKDDNLEVVAGVDLTGDNEYIPVYKDINQVKEDFDIIIDFSSASSLKDILVFAKANKKSVVLASTGYSKEDEDLINKYSKDIPIFKSSNMSLDINIMCEIVSKLALLLENNDIEIVEVHHRNKVDSPSGTALMLANSINEVLNNKMEYVYNRHELKQKRTDKEIGIHSIRGGTEVGKHSVMFYGDNESFEITHTVTNRSIFARGAIKAAIFLSSKKNGLYNMKDLIGE